MANGGRIDFTVGFNVDKSGLTEIRNQLNEIKKMTPTDIMNLNPGMKMNEARSEFMKLQKSISQIDVAFKSAFNTTTQQMNLTKLNTSLKQLDIQKVATSFKSAGAQGQQAFFNITKSALTANLQLKQTQTLADKMGTTLINTLKWNISSSLINRFTGAFQQAYGYVQHLDTSLNDIRIVTGKSADEMDRFAVNANKAAKDLGKATTDYTEAALIYYQQGLADDEVRARTETTLKAANVTGQSTSEVSEQLTAVWNGYRIQASETEQSVDRLAAVAATTAADLEELSTGMSKVAAAANSMGVDMDQLNATIATIESVTRQAPESVGTALKTIYARMGDLKLGETDEDGLGLGEVSGTLEKVGIDVLDVNGDLRDMGVVIEEIGAKWDTWTKAEQTAIAEAVAGKRQYNNLFALFDNWDMYTKALETSRNSMGTLQKQQDIYMESTTAHIQKLKTQWEDLYDSILDKDSINGLIDGLTEALSLFTNFIDGIGGGKNALLTFGSTALTVFSKQISNELMKVVVNIKAAKENMQQLNAQRANVKLFEAAQGMSGSAGADAIIEAQKQMQLYYGILSNEQIEEATRIAKEVGETENLKQQWEGAADAVTQYIQAVGKTDIVNSKTGGAILGTVDPKTNQHVGGYDAQKTALDNQNSQIREAANTALKDMNKTIDDLSTVNDYVGKLYANLLKTKEASGETWENFLKGNKAAGKSLQEMDDTLQILIDNLDTIKSTGVFKDSDINIDNVIQQMNNAKQAIDNLAQGTGKAGVEGGKATKAFKGFSDNLKIGLKDAKAYNAQMQSNKRAVEDMGLSFNSSKDALNHFLDQAVIQNSINNFVQLAGGIGQVASGLNSIKNLGNIWNNEDLTAGEKILQTMTSLGMGASMLVSGLSRVSSSWTELLPLMQKNAAAFIASGQALSANNISFAENVRLQREKIEQKKKEKLLDQQQRAEIIKNTAATEAETVAEGEEVIASEGQIAANTVETVTLDGLIAATWAHVKALAAQTVAMAKAHPVITAIAAAVVVLGAAINAAHQHTINMQKDMVEAGEKEINTTNKQIEATQEHIEAVEKLTNDYKSLASQYEQGALTLDQLRSKTYELCQQYGVQVNAIDILTGSYEDLEEAIRNANNEAAQDSVEANQKNIDAKKRQLVNKSQLYLSENSGVSDTFKDLFSNMTVAADSKLADYMSYTLHGYTFDFEKFYASSEQEQTRIINALKPFESVNESAKNILNAIKENQGLADEINQQEDSQKQSIIDTIFNSIVPDTEQITDLEKYNDIKEKLADRIATQLQITIEEATKLAEEKLKSQSGTAKIQAGIELAPELSKAFNTDENSIIDQISKLSSSDLKFLKDNLNLAEAYDSLDEFFAKYKEVKENLERKDNILNVQVALTNADGKQFKPEDIEAMFQNESFSIDIGMTQEEFSENTYQQQMANLLTYYLTANKLESDFEHNKKQALIDEQKRQKQNLVEQQGKLETIKNDIINAYQGVGEAALSEQFQNSINDMLQNVMDEASRLGYDIVDETGLEILEKYINGVEELTADESKYIDLLLNKVNGDEERLGLIYRETQAYEKYNEKVKEAGLETGDYRKVAKKLADQLSETEKIISDIDLSDIDWSSFKEGVKGLLDYTNSSIDSLQSAYNSLTSIMEEYNETQTLSMDNLQTFLNMDTAYLSALEIENGQMTLNEEALKQVALARLDEAEAEAYMQAMAELNNEETRKGIEQSQQAVIQLSSLGGAAVNAAEAARSGIDAWREYWDAALNREGIDNDAYAQQVGDALRNKLQMINQVRDQILSGKFSETMKGSSASKSSSSESEKEPEHLDNLERETDLYRTINAELDNIEKTLNRIQKVESHEWGIDYQKSLEEENKLLDKQLQKLQEKKKLQEQDLSVRRKQLEDVGVAFSADGTAMQNAEAVLNGLYANYNSMVDKYNSMSAAQQEGYKATLEAEKDRIDKIGNKMSEYESTFSEYQSTLDSLLEVHYQQIENEIKKFNNMVEVHLELSEAKREWEDFWYDVVQDMQDDDYMKQIEKSIAKLGSLIGTTLDNADSDVAVLTKHLAETVNEVEAQILSANRGGEDSLFGDDTAAAKENLEDYRDKLIQALTDAKEEIDNISETYIKMLEHAQDLIDDQVEGWEAINDHLEHNVELIKLITGDKAFDALNKQYEQQYENNLNLIKTQKQSQDFWAGEIQRYKDLLSITEENTIQWKTYSEALEKASENYREAVQDLDKTVEKAIKDLETWRKNQTDAIFDAVDKAISGGLGLDLLEQEWKLINDEAGKYLDNVQRAYSMEEYANELDQAANAIGLSAENQAKLNAFREEELQKLREKDKLTKYDIEESRARLAILQQQLALEDAQRNKSNLRLRRDSQGNYTYQYTADQGAVEDAQGGLLTAKKEWYELVKARRKETNDWIIEAEKNLTSILTQIDEAQRAGDTERVEELKKLEQLARQDVVNAYAEAGKNIQDIYSGTAQFFADVNNASILPENQATVSQLVMQWTGSGEESFIGAVNKGIEDLDKVQIEWSNRTKAILQEAGVNYTDLKENGIDPTTESLEEMVQTNEELAYELENVNTQLTEQEGNLRQVESAYYSLQAAAVSAISSANAALNTLAQTAIQTQMQVAAAVAAANAAAAITGYPSYQSNSRNTGNGNGGNGKIPPDRKWGYKASTSDFTRGDTYTNNSNYNGKYYVNNMGGEYAKKYAYTPTTTTSTRSAINYATDPRFTAPKQTVSSSFINQEASATDIINGNAYWDPTLKKYIKTFATGGYTGAWPGSDGKLAILHQKELVLNETDTQNILGAVNAIRALDFSGVAKALIQSSAVQGSVLSRLGSGVLNNVIPNQSENISNTKNIIVNADFSGVRSADAIYEALISLENVGMQTAYSSAPHAGLAY